jgi:CheY-like chemotaxis protein
MSPSPDADQPIERRILVVDDEPTLRLAFCYALQDARTRVEAVADGCSALARLGNTRFDLVILDLRMPHLDGAAVLDIIRDSGNSVPVILCTALISPGLVLRSSRHGVVDFLLKPVMPSTLRQAVDFVIHPERWPTPAAWKAARNGDFKSAADHLRQHGQLTPREAAWLQIWETSPSFPVSASSTADELGLLALNGPVAR